MGIVDAIVTTPKNRMAESAREAALAQRWKDLNPDGDYWYWRDYKFKPFVEPGDRVYYVEDGYVRGFCLVDHIDDHEYNADGQIVYRVLMDATSWKWIQPIPMIGFRGIRKMINQPHLMSEVRVIAGWRDPRPELEGT